jgi:hypothetical protein
MVANPVIPGFHPDPSVCRVGGDYFLACSSGLAVRLDERHHYLIEAAAGEVRCLARIGPLTQQVAARPAGAGPIVLGVDIDAGPTEPGAVGSPPDVVRLGVAGDGRLEPLAELDGRYLSTEVAGGFTGRVIGMYAARGTVAFDWYEYTPAARVP